MSRPLFHYDFNSPYAYLAAERIDEVIPDAEWRPIAFGIIVVQLDKVPWSFTEPDAGKAIVAERAADRGLPPLTYPDGWPKSSYSLMPLRAALVAEDHGLLEEFSLEVFRVNFVRGESAADPEAVLRAAERVGLPREAVEEGVGDPRIKARLRRATDEAIAAGVSGVPTVRVGGELFWGDDRLEYAASALSGSR